MVYDFEAVLKSMKKMGGSSKHVEANPDILFVNKFYKLKKQGQKENDGFVSYVFKTEAFPFNPFMPTVETEYSDTNKYRLKTSVSTFLKTLKRLMLIDPVICNFYKKHSEGKISLEDTFEEKIKVLKARLLIKDSEKVRLALEKLDAHKISEKDFDVKLFTDIPSVMDRVTESDKEYLDRFSEPRMAIKTIVMNKSKAMGQYGAKYLSLTTYSTDPATGAEIVQGDISYKLNQLEQAFAYAEIEKEIKPNGERDQKSEENIQSDIKACLKAQLVSNPYPSGVLEGLSIPCNDKFEVDPKLNLDLMSPFGAWFSGGKDTLTFWKNLIGRPEDTSVDFIEGRVYYNLVPLGTAETEKARLVNSGRTHSEGSNTNISLLLKRPKIEQAIIEFLDNPKNLEEEVILRSIPAFRLKDEALILAAYKPELESKMRLMTPAIATQFSEIIGKISAELSAKAMRMSLAGVSTGVVDPKLLAEVTNYIVDENTTVEHQAGSTFDNLDEVEEINTSGINKSK